MRGVLFDVTDTPNCILVDHDRSGDDRRSSAERHQSYSRRANFRIITRQWVAVLLLDPYIRLRTLF